MAEPYWTCGVCGFQAQSEEEKQRHMRETANEPKHQEAMKGTGAEPRP